MHIWLKIKGGKVVETEKKLHEQSKKNLRNVFEVENHHAGAFSQHLKRRLTILPGKRLETCFLRVV